MSLTTELRVMKQAAVEAGRALVADFHKRGELQIDAKGRHDFVTDADRRSEAIIVRLLRAAFPAHAILGEEGGDYGDTDGGARWIIDPLDGTTNFLHGMPHWCVTIALEQGGAIVAGVTYDPLRSEMFEAALGQGAFLNGAPIHVSTCVTLDDAVIGMAAWGDAAEMEKFGALFLRAYIACPNVLTTASTALDLAYVAAGRLDACYSKGGAQPWDMAAGVILNREAGGVIVSHDGRPASIYKNEVVAGNAVLYKAVMQLTGT